MAEPVITSAPPEGAAAAAAGEAESPSCSRGSTSRGGAAAADEGLPDAPPAAPLDADIPQEEVEASKEDTGKEEDEELDRARRVADIAAVWQAATADGAALRERLALHLVDAFLGSGDKDRGGGDLASSDPPCPPGSLLLAEVTEAVAVQAVREMADAYTLHTLPFVRVDPFVRLMTELADGVVPDLCRQVVRESVTEVAGDIMLTKRCLIALRGLEDECISDLLHTSDIFDQALEEEEESQAVERLLGAVVGELVLREATAAVQTFEAEARQVDSSFQRSAVDRVAQLVISRRVALGHLMMSISNHFAAVLLEHHTMGVAFRLALERVLAHLYSAEERVDVVSDNSLIEHAFAEATIPTIQVRFVLYLLFIISISRLLF
jgi:hypothetical protein